MITVPEIVLERVAAVGGDGASLFEMSVEAARKAAQGADVAAVIAATFSNPERFPALSVRVAAALGLPPSTAAFDLQLACSAYPYAVYLAGRIAADTGRQVLVIDGDAQTRLVNRADRATGEIFSDAATATLILSFPDERTVAASFSSSRATPGELAGGPACAKRGESAAMSAFDFLSREDAALTCGETGPIKMDGFKVFSFVATEVSKWLKTFIAAAPAFDLFAPHQANPYMVRQLAKSLGLESRLLTIPDDFKNPGSCSVALALERGWKPNARALIAGFGAGYSASAGIVRLGEGLI